MTKWFGDFPRLRSTLPHLEVLGSTPSTNDVLKSPGQPDYSAVVTNDQSAGRGRLGRTWVLHPGRGLAMSFLVPRLTQSQQKWIPVAVGVALVRALRAEGIVRANLKWPNDVLVDDRKLAGILCEVSPDGRVIVGMGVNVDAETGYLPSLGATSLGEFVEISHDRVDALLESLVASVKFFCESPEDGSLEWVREGASEVVSTIGRQVSVHDGDGSVWEGTAVSMTAEGHLVVLEASGASERIVVASDITHLRQ